MIFSFAIYWNIFGFPHPSPGTCFFGAGEGPGMRLNCYFVSIKIEERIVY